MWLVKIFPSFKDCVILHKIFFSVWKELARLSFKKKKLSVVVAFLLIVAILLEIFQTSKNFFPWQPFQDFRSQNGDCIDLSFEPF